MLRRRLTTNFSFSVSPRIDIEACKHPFTCRYISKAVTVSLMKHLIISDFDETITNRDTTCILGQLPYEYDPCLEPKWSHFVNNYWENYKKFQSEAVNRTLPLLNGEETAAISDSNFHKLFQSEVEFQTRKRLLELSSTTEIAAKDIFKGVKHSQVREFVDSHLQGSNSLLRPGFEEFISLVPKSRLHVVSVNWSREFITAVVGESNVDPEHVACNNLTSQGDEYTGDFTNSILTGSDKIKVIADILKEYDEEGGNCPWYVGDSDTDLLGVLYPNLNGVLLINPIAEAEKFYKITTKLLGLSQQEMQNFAHGPEGWFKCHEKQGEKFVYLVKSWRDLQNLMFTTQSP